MFEVTCLLDLYLLVFSQLDLKGAISLLSHNSRQHSPRVTLRTETMLALSCSSHLYSEEQILRLTEDRCREPPHMASSSGRESRCRCAVHSELLHPARLFFLSHSQASLPTPLFKSGVWQQV